MLHKAFSTPGTPDSLGSDNQQHYRVQRPAIAGQQAGAVQLDRCDQLSSELLASARMNVKVRDSE